MTSIVDDSIAKPPVRDQDAERQNWNDGLTLAFHILLPLAIAGIIWGRKVIISRLLLQLDRSCVSVFCPSFSKREKLIKWVMIHLPYLEGGLGSIWRDGSQLCTLINTVVPGACPNPHRHWRKPPTHGQALAYKYLGVIPIFSENDLNERNFSAPIEKSLLQYITTLQEAIEKISHGDELTFTNHYIARGMGLVTGEQHRKTIIYIYPNCKHEDLENLLINIRGPYNSYGATTLHCHDLVKLKRKINVNTNEEMSKPENKSFLKSLSSNFSNLLTMKTPKSPLTDIDIKIDIEKDRAKILFIPTHSGVYELCLTTAGEHIGGSPYNINIEKNRSGINDAICESQGKVALVRKQILDKIRKFSPKETTEYTPYKEFVENNVCLNKLKEIYKDNPNDKTRKQNQINADNCNLTEKTKSDQDLFKVVEQVSILNHDIPNKLNDKILKQNTPIKSKKSDQDLFNVVKKVSMLKHEIINDIPNKSNDEIQKQNKTVRSVNSKVIATNESDQNLYKVVERVSVPKEEIAKNIPNKSNEEIQKQNNIIRSDNSKLMKKSDQDLYKVVAPKQENLKVIERNINYKNQAIKQNEENNNEIILCSSEHNDSKHFLKQTEMTKTAKTNFDSKHYNPDLLVGHTNGININTPPVLLTNTDKDVKPTMTNKTVSNVSDRNITETFSHKIKLRKCRSAFDTINDRNLPNLVAECSCDISNSDDSLDLRLSFMRRKEFWDKMSTSNLSLNSSSLSLNDITETSSHRRIMRLNRLTKSKLKNDDRDTGMFRSLDFIQQRRRSIKNEIPLMMGDKYGSVDELSFPSVKERRSRFLKEKGSDIVGETIVNTRKSDIKAFIEDPVKIEVEIPIRNYFGSIHDKIKLFDKNVTHTERRYKQPMMKLNTCVIESKVSKIKKIPENGTIKTKIKERFEKAQSFFKELESASTKSNVHKEHVTSNINLLRRHSLGNNDGKLKRSAKGGSLRVLNVSEKFNISNLYKDILGDKSNTNIFKGAPNKKAVVRTLTVFTPEINNNNNNESQDKEELPLDLFLKNNNLKKRKSIHDIFTY